MTDQIVAAVDGALLVIELGNGASPEVFTPTCTINTSRSVDFSASATATELADCTTPTLPAQTVRQIKSTDSKFSGAGVADAPSILALIQWFASGAQKNIRLVQNLSGANGGWTVAGGYVCTALQVAGTRGEMQTFSITIEQASGSPTVTANA